MTDRTGHGSCVAAKAVGSPHGVSRSSNLVIAKLPEFKNSRGKLESSYRSANLLKGFCDILEDINEYGIADRTVFTLSLVCAF